MTNKTRLRLRKRYGEIYRPAYLEWIKCYPFSTADLDGEEWQEISGYENYLVSNYGRTKRLSKNGSIKIMKPHLTINGYLYVNISKRGTTKKFYVHLLVAACFIPEVEGKTEIDHINGDKFNCCVTNLRRVTSSENKQAAIELGLIRIGSDRPESSLTNEQVKYIRENPEGLMSVELGKMFGVNVSVISDAQLGKKYKRVGGTIRKAKEQKYTPRLSDDIRAKIKAEYIKGSSEHGTNALAKKYGVRQGTIWRIINCEK